MISRALGFELLDEEEEDGQPNPSAPHYDCAGYSIGASPNRGVTRRPRTYDNPFTGGEGDD